MRRSNFRAVFAGCVLALGFSGAAMAACPPGIPKGVACGAPDLKLAPAGAYDVDPSHAGVRAA